MSDSLDLVRDAVIDLNGAVYRDVKTSGGEINPLEILQRLTLLSIETAALRELVTHLMATDESGVIDLATKHGALDCYHGILVDGIRAEIAMLIAPKIVRANGSDG
jgi:hypothetical protein